MLPEALLKRLAKRGIVQGDGTPAAASKQPTNIAAPIQQQQQHQAQSDHSDSSSKSNGKSDSDEDDDDDGEERREADEEIIAEDYDESYDQVNPEAFEYPLQKKKANPAMDWTEKMKQKMIKRYGFQSVDGCQNKYNIYHHCTMYCVQRYGEVEFEIDKEYEKRVKRLLERYPLPRHWRKEYDIGCKAFYFYNKETRIVSWLPPTHPDAKMTKSAKVLRKELMEKIKDQQNANDSAPKAVIVESYPPPPKAVSLPSREPNMMIGPTAGAEHLKPPVVNPPKRPHHAKPPPPYRDDEKRPRMGGNGPGRLDRDRDQDRHRDYRDRNRDRERDRERDRGDRDRERGRRDDYDDHRNRDRNRDRGGGRGRQINEALDPMDPAAYSDIPRGTWASGLEAASGATKKDKDKDRGDKKEEKGKKGTARNDDSDDEHEVLKVAPINEFTQDDDKDE
ncbi:regulator of nonsense transcripts 3B [Uranotaenia lowii]|uniref:regulator of nonsense transcripts 3B n=1 Tax=Uranotaenia lowii TaxID=190385 RepID=UPI0024798513|nr:regulator of nonsense transcripts 3B [Uranotaenia lowii]